MSQCTVGILPAGTANDFATACQIPTNDAGAALRTAAEAPIAKIDIGRVNDRLFVNATSGGYGAEVTATAPPELKNTLGGFAYLVNGLLHVPEIRSRRAHVRAPKFQWEGDMIGFSVANGRQAGGGFQIAPSATVDDGLLDLVVFPEVQKGGWSGLLTDLLSKAEEEELEYLVSRRAPWFEIEVEEAIHFNIDGEPLEATSLHFDILEKKARFCLPLSDLWTP
jgi:lipid kinase YegS